MAAGGIADLLAALPMPTGVLSFVTEGDGLVGWGVYDSIRTSGAGAAERIARWWAEQCLRFAVTDEVKLPGTGPVVFVSLGFAGGDPSIAVIPRCVLGRAGRRRFATVVGDPDAATLPVATPVRSPGEVRYSDGRLSAAGYARAVRTAVDRIRRNDLAKVVLAHDLRADTELPIDERYVLSRLAAAYPTCVTFAVDRLVGASPEMLVRRHGRRVSSRVLAGTAWPEHAGEHTAGLVATHLLGSAKDVEEHRYAVRSVAESLAEVTDDVRVPPDPTTLPLANLTHLVTDVTARLPAHLPRGVVSPSSALALAARLHPTAAVGGTPRQPAMELIAELEPSGRGRYAAPIGWMDGNGDGEFALALRCAQLDESGATLLAGCGVVADSDPVSEVREAAVKMVPIRDALSS